MGRKIEYEFTAVDNKMLEALIKIRLPANERSILDIILRQTIGYQVKEKWISWSTLEKMSGIDKRNISKLIKSLEKKGIIFKNGRIYSVERDLNKWEGVSPEIHLKEVSSEIHPDVSDDTLKVSSEIQTKETPKESFKRKVLSKAKEGGKEREAPDGLKQLREDLRKMPGLEK